MKIPKSFKLLGQEISVTYKKNLRDKRNFLGEVYPDKNIIELQDLNCSGINIPKSKIEETFYHERTHLILDSMGENELSGNEKFIEVFSGLLYQADNTAVYDED